jgi:hypothetical protein
MAFWTDTNANLQNALAGKSQFVEENKLVANGALWGPTPDQLKPLFPQLFPNGAQTTDTPWDSNAVNCVGIGCNNTYWVLNPQSQYYGVWVLNASSSEAATNAQKANAPTQYGFYAILSTNFPPIASLLASGLPFQANFTNAYYQYFPSQNPLPPGTQTTTGPGGTVQPVTKTWEVFGTLNGQKVPLNQVLQQLGPGNWQLAAGGAVNVGTSINDGFGLGGNPGKWALFSGGATPQSFGLSPNQGVLWWDGAQGQVLTGATLADMYSPQPWQPIIYQGSPS